MVEPDQTLYCGVVALLQCYHFAASTFFVSPKRIHFGGKYFFQIFWIWKFFWKFFLAFFARSIPYIFIFARSIPYILRKSLGMERIWCWLRSKMMELELSKRTNGSFLRSLDQWKMNKNKWTHKESDLVW